VSQFFASCPSQEVVVDVKVIVMNLKLKNARGGEFFRN